MSPFYLPILTAVAANSFLNLGFGIRQLVLGRRGETPPVLAPAVAVFLSGFLVWPLFASALAPLSLGYLENLLLLPFSVFVSIAVERALRALSALSAKEDSDQPPGAPAPLPIRPSAALSSQPRSYAHTAYDGLAYVSAFLSLRYSSGLADAALLSLGGAIGYILCAVILNAVRERSDTEPVPVCLRGTPLLLIASGLLSMLAFFLASIAFSATGALS